MSRRALCIVLCEDTQHDVFARRFLEREGYETRDIRVVKAPGGLGAAEQFVRRRFPEELTAYRSRPNQLLVVLIDGDNVGVEERKRELARACREASVQERTGSERVVILVPTWNIETWFAYLDGQEVVEGRSNYPRLPRERNCKRHVDILAGMCKQRRLRVPVPPSLEAACSEYRARINP
jgi:hypothetical protein